MDGMRSDMDAVIEARARELSSMFASWQHRRQLKDRIYLASIMKAWKA